MAAPQIALPSPRTCFPRGGPLVSVAMRTDRVMAGSAAVHGAASSAPQRRMQERSWTRPARPDQLIQQPRPSCSMRSVASISSAFLFLCQFVFQTRPTLSHVRPYDLGIWQREQRLMTTSTSPGIVKSRVIQTVGLSVQASFKHPSGCSWPSPNKRAITIFTQCRSWTVSFATTVSACGLTARSASPHRCKK